MVGLCVIITGSNFKRRLIMNAKHKKTLVSSAVILFSLLVIAGGVYIGCGSSPLIHAGLDFVRVYLGTQSPGDAWSWTIYGIDSGTFEATNHENGYYYSGDFTGVGSGYNKYTVISSTQPGLSLPRDVYGLELPGTAFYINDPNGNIIVATAKRESERLS